MFIGYSEKHHIIPRCMGGNDNKENFVSLTAREHFICHQLLFKIYKDNSKLLYAAFRMSKYKTYGSKKYSWLKIKFCESMREIALNRSPEQKAKFTNKYTPRTKEWNDKINPKGRKHTNETKKKMSDWQKGVPKSEETKEKLRQKRSPETIERIKLAAANRPLVTCIFCKKTMNLNLFKQWHNGKCLSK